MADTTDARPATPYRVLRGVSYKGRRGGDKRAEPGDVVTDLPEESVGWLLDDGAIELA